MKEKEYMNGIEYPFDSIEVLRKKKTIKRRLDEQSNMIEVRIAILCGSTIGDIKDVLEIFLLSFGIKVEFHIGQYDRFYEDVLFENQELIDFKPDIIIIHTSLRNYNESDLWNKLNAIWYKIHETFKCTIIQNNFELPISSFAVDCCEINRLNVKLAEYADINKDFYINDIQALSAIIGLNEWFNEHEYYLYKYAFSVKAIPAFCYNVAKIIKSLYGKNQKCLVLDLDNTLWGGVFGDVGMSGIELGPETAVGESYLIFQKYVKALHSRGIILAVCSKNDEDTAREAFKNPNMVLQLDDIAVFCANWDSKADNITRIAEKLNIFPDSIVFIDDNPAERELVRSALPEVKVPEARSALDFIRLIEEAGYFYLTQSSDDDLKRNEYYATDKKRNEIKKNFIDYGDYLHSLQMKSTIAAFDSEHLDRITQLINKTNQFNLTTKRYSQSEVETISADSGYITLYATLDDKFGSNGIVSAMIAEIEGKNLHIRLWVMSCRVFKRDLELSIFDKLIEVSKKSGVKKLTGYYFKTDKNKYVSDLFNDLGFDNVTESIWEYAVPSDYCYKNKHIQVEKDN